MGVAPQNTTVRSLPKSVSLPKHNNVQSVTRPADDMLVDNWESNIENFEAEFPRWACQTVLDNSSDGYERKWGVDNKRAISPPLSDESSAWAAWPARDGADG